MNFFREDSRVGILDEFGNEAAGFVVNPSFRLKSLKNPHKYIYIKNKKDNS